MCLSVLQTRANIAEVEADIPEMLACLRAVVNSASEFPTKFDLDRADAQYNMARMSHFGLSIKERVDLLRSTVSIYREYLGPDNDEAHQAEDSLLRLELTMSDSEDGDEDEDGGEGEGDPHLPFTP